MNAGWLEKGGLAVTTPTPNPAPRGGELFWAQFFGACAPKNCADGVSPSPWEGVGGWVFRLALT